MALITSTIGLATLAVSPGWMRHTWVSFCAGTKTESQTAAVPAFPSRPGFSQPSQLLSAVPEFPRVFLPGWKNCRPLRFLGWAWSPFCGSIYSIERVGLPSTTCCCCCCKGFDRQTEGVMVRTNLKYCHIYIYVVFHGVSRKEVLATSWKICPATIACFLL